MKNYPCLDRLRNKGYNNYNTLRLYTDNAVKEILSVVSFSLGHHSLGWPLFFPLWTEWPLQKHWADLVTLHLTALYASPPIALGRRPEFSPELPRASQGVSVCHPPAVFTQPCSSAFSFSSSGSLHQWRAPPETAVSSPPPFPSLAQLANHDPQQSSYFFYDFF